MEENEKIIQEELAKIKEKRESILNKCKEELSKIDERRDPKSYKEGLEELSARQKELDSIVLDIKSYNENNQRLNEYSENEKRLCEDKQKKLNDYKKTEEQFNKIKEQKDKDPQLYREGLEELNARQKEFNEIREKLTDIRKELVRIKEIKNNMLNKYKIQEKLIQDINKDTERNNDGTLKNPPVLKNKVIERNEDGTLKNPPVLKNENNGKSVYNTLKNSLALEDEDPERNEDGTLKNPPVLKDENNKKSVDDTLKIPSILENDDNERNNDEDMLIDSKPTENEIFEIIYCGKDNKYIVNTGERQLEGYAMELKNKKEKKQYIHEKIDEDDLNKIFKDTKMNNKIIKKIDPQLLVILAAKDLNYAKSYVDELAKGKYAEKDDLPYKMTYNLKGMRKNSKENKMSLIQRIKTNRMAKNNKNVAEYIPDDKNRKKWLIIPAAAALALGTTSMAHKNNEDKDIDLTDLDISDTIKPTQKPQMGPETKPENIDQTIDSSTDTTIDSTIIDNNDQEQKNSDLVLGCKVNLQDGITYTDDSFDKDVTYEIGQFSWRPAGDYTVDRVALHYDGKLLENLEVAGTNVDEKVKEYSEKLGVDPSEIIQVAHVCLGEDHVGATGWLDNKQMSVEQLKSQISKSYEEILKEQSGQAKNTKKQQPQEQTHEER